MLVHEQHTIFQNWEEVKKPIWVLRTQSSAFDSLQHFALRTRLRYKLLFHVDILSAFSNGTYLYVLISTGGYKAVDETWKIADEIKQKRSFVLHVLTLFYRSKHGRTVGFQRQQRDAERCHKTVERAQFFILRQKNWKSIFLQFACWMTGGWHLKPSLRWFEFRLDWHHRP